VTGVGPRRRCRSRSAFSDGATSGSSGKPSRQLLPDRAHAHLLEQAHGQQEVHPDRDGRANKLRALLDSLITIR
jgi:hypothetical protein